MEKGLIVWLEKVAYLIILIWMNEHAILFQKVSSYL
jgi:hypothetical protein